MKTSINSLYRETLFASIATAALLLALETFAKAEPKQLPSDVTRVAVVFSGGHETEGVDHGRPVVLIAAALGVKPEVFTRPAPAAAGLLTLKPARTRPRS
jgi:hypothetical protein